MTTNRATPRPAFMSDAAYSVGNLTFPAVVTADYVDRDTGTFEIVFELLGWTGGYDPISLTINDGDIQAVRELLGIGRVQSNVDSWWQVDMTTKLLKHALKTLCLIADLEDVKIDPADSWRETLFRVIEKAQRTVDQIKIEAERAELNLETDDGTPSDS